MTCSKCGAAAAAADQVFCQSCGAPMADAETTPAVTHSSPGGARRVRQDFTGGAIPLFGWLVLVSISVVLIVPAPFAVVAYARWLMSKCRLENGSSYRFLATAGSVWVLTTSYGLVQLINVAASVQAEKEPVYNWVLLVVLPANLVMGWLFLRWWTGGTEAAERRLRFEGSVWGLIGWSLLIYVSILTIIGWAWAFVGYSDWLAKNVRGPGLRYEFVGKGHQVLWRTLAYILFLVPIVTIPWSIQWYLRWFVQQFELVETPQSG